MDEQRDRVYLNLISQLLFCNEGDEAGILGVNQGLLNWELVEVMARQYGDAG